jgi:hypothetical protein
LPKVLCSATRPFEERDGASGTRSVLEKGTEGADRAGQYLRIWIEKQEHRFVALVSTMIGGVGKTEVFAERTNQNGWELFCENACPGVT